MSYKISPCNDCPDEAECRRASCLAWEQWFRAYWRALRKKYLGIYIPGEEAANGK